MGERTHRSFLALDRPGLSPLAIDEGTFGAFAQAIGGATVLLLAPVAPEREVLLGGMAR